jgi:DNA-binding response OmpR family regulator
MAEARPTILIADDDPAIVQLLMQALAPDAYRIVTANDGETALRLARSQRPALILLDWQMPGVEGTDVTRALRDDADPALRDIPVVLITGRGGAEDTAEGFAAGVTDYLTKPFRAAHVRTRVQAWLLRRPDSTA